jgi:hypothetical protein
MKPHVKYGLLTGVICTVLYVLQTYLTSEALNVVITLGSYVIIAAMIYMAVKERRGTRSYFSFGEAFSTGLLVSLIAGAIVVIPFYINAKFLNHDFIDLQRLRSDEVFEDKFPAEMANLILSPGLFTFGAFIKILLVGGIIISLIIAAILKRGERNPMVVSNNGPGMAQ